MPLNDFGCVSCFTTTGGNVGVATCEVVALVLAMLVLSCTEAGVTEVTGAFLLHTFSVSVTFAVCFAVVACVTSDEANCVTVTFGIAV